MTGDLVERLRSALDRAEKIAREATIQPQAIVEALGRVREADARFVVMARPDVVLRTIQAHRKILDRHYPLWRVISFMATEVYDGVASTDEYHEEIAVCGRCVRKHSHFGSREDVPEYPCDDVRDLAAVYFPEETTDGAG